MSASSLDVRSLVVNVPKDRAWRYFNRAAEWPSWHADVTRVDLSPPGEIGPTSTAVLHARKGPSTAFRVTQFVPEDHWTWESKLLWLTMAIDHRFESVGSGQTRITLAYSLCGAGSSLAAKALARAVAASLDKDLPALEREMNQRA